MMADDLEEMVGHKMGDHMGVLLRDTKRDHRKSGNERRIQKRMKKIEQRQVLAEFKRLFLDLPAFRDEFEPEIDSERCDTLDEILRVLVARHGRRPAKVSSV